MKPGFFLLIMTIIICSLCGCGNLVGDCINDISTDPWLKPFGGTGTDVGRSVAVDEHGNVYMSGYFKGTVDFGGGDITSNGGSDIFLAKYSSDGTFLWVKTFGDTSDDVGYSVAVDSNDNAYVAGYFAGTVDFGGGTVTSSGPADIFLAKYSPDGTCLWVKFFGGTSDDIGFSVAVDRNGNAYVTGYFQGTADFGGGSVTSSGSYDVVIAKYSSTGTFLWAKTFGSTGADLGFSLAIDRNGNAYVTGYFQGTADFGGGSVTSNGAADIFVAKYSSTGTFLWAKTFGDTTASNTSDDYGYSLAVDANENVYVSGFFNGTADFGGGSITSNGAADIFLAKYSSTGTFLWAKTFGDTTASNANDDYGSSLTVDANENVYITGFFNGTADFGGGDVSSNGSSDIFVAKYSSGGTFLWAKTFGDTTASNTSTDQGMSVAVDASHNIYVTGFFNGTISTDSGTAVSSGAEDVFLIKYIQ